MLTSYISYVYIDTFLYNGHFFQNCYIISCFRKKYCSSISIFSSHCWNCTQNIIRLKKIFEDGKKRIRINCRCTSKMHSNLRFTMLYSHGHFFSCYRTLDFCLISLKSLVNYDIRNTVLSKIRESPNFVSILFEILPIPRCFPRDGSLCHIPSMIGAIGGVPTYRG